MARTLIIVVALLAASRDATSWQSRRGGAERPPPNFVFILADDLGFGEFSAYGQPKFKTPNIDALFKSGMRFNDAYANTVCAPSRASLFLGKHTGHSPIRGNKGVVGGDLPLAPEDTTFFESLRAGANYSVSCIGKWGAGSAASTGAPWKKGCTKYYGVLNQGAAHNMYPNTHNIVSYTEDNGLTELSFPENEGASRGRCMAPGNNCTWTGDLWTKATLEDLEQQAARQDAERAAGASVAPFFLYLAVTSPHAGNWNGGPPGSGNPVPSDGPFASEPWPDVMKDHAAVIQEFHDKAVGEILDRLDLLGLRQDTVVIYYSDNGAMNEGRGYDYKFFEASGPLTGYKRWLSEGGVRVPFAVSWPGVIPAGVVSDSPVAIWDAAPTILSMADIYQDFWPANMDGISLYEDLLLPGAPTQNYSHPPLYWETCTRLRFDRVTRKGTGWSHAVRDGDYKAIWQFNEGKYSQLQLFHLPTDISERFDVSAERPEISARMESIAEASRTDNALFPRTDACDLA